MGFGSLLRCFSPKAERSAAGQDVPRVVGPVPKSHCESGDAQSSFLVQLTMDLHNCTAAKPTPMQQLELGLEVVKSQLNVAAALMAVFSDSCSSYSLLSNGVCCEKWLFAKPEPLHGFNGNAPSCIARAFLSNSEIRFYSVNGPMTADLEALVSACMFKSFATVPVALGDRKHGVLVLCGATPDTFACERRQRPALQVAQCWLAQAFSDGSITSLSTQLEQVHSACNVQELTQVVASSLNLAQEGPGSLAKLNCSIAIFSDDYRSATMFSVASTVKSERRRASSHHPFLDSMDLMVSSDSVLAGSVNWAVATCPAGFVDNEQHPSAWGKNTEVVGQCFILEGTLLSSVVKEKQGVVVMDCMALLQERSPKHQELLLAANCPAKSALLVEAIFDAYGQPCMGLYVSLPKAVGQPYMQALATRVKEQLAVLQGEIARKLSMLSKWTSGSSTLNLSAHDISSPSALQEAANSFDFSSGRLPCPDPSPSGGRLSRSISASRLLMPLVAGLQDQLHSLQRMHLQAVGGEEKPSDLRSLRLKRLVGKGAFGRVYLGCYRGMDLAVKVIPWQSSESCVMQKAVELAVLTTLNHPNIVQVSTFFPEALLVCSNQRCKSSTPWLITMQEWEDEVEAGEISVQAYSALRAMVICMEYCDLGTVTDAIIQGSFKMQPPAAVHGPSGSFMHELAQPQPNLRNILLVLMETAWALAYLHRMHLVHRDIKPSNILLKASLIDPRGYTTKLSDFGLVKMVTRSEDDAKPPGSPDSAEAANTKPRFSGTVTHCPPELLVNGNQTQLTGAADIYALGILMYELYTSSPVYPHMNSDQILNGVVHEGLRPTFPDHCPADFALLAEQCWAPHPAQRPSAEQVAIILDSILRRVVGPVAAGFPSSRRQRASLLGGKPA